MIPYMLILSDDLILSKYAKNTILLSIYGEK
jgi:hypothetical protein